MCHLRKSKPVRSCPTGTYWTRKPYSGDKFFKNQREIYFAISYTTSIGYSHASLEARFVTKMKVNIFFELTSKSNIFHIRNWVEAVLPDDKHLKYCGLWVSRNKNMFSFNVSTNILSNPLSKHILWKSSIFIMCFTAPSKQ